MFFGYQVVKPGDEIAFLVSSVVAIGCISYCFIWLHIKEKGIRVNGRSAHG
jgi:hypothetical protein